MILEADTNNFFCLFTRHENSEKSENNDAYGILLAVFGILSCCGNAWVVVTGAQRWTGLRTPHKLLVQTCFIALLYSTTTIVSAPSMIANRLAWRASFGMYICWIYAYVSHVSYTLELQSLAMLTIAVYFKQASVSIGLKTYAFIICFIWISSLVWGALPFHGIGKYGCQYGEVVCNLQWAFDSHLQKWYNILYGLLGVGLPSVLIVIYLLKLVCGSTENKIIKGYRNAMLVHGSGVLISRLIDVSMTTLLVTFGPYTELLEASKRALVQHQASCLFGVVAWVWCDDELRKLLLGSRKGFRTASNSRPSSQL